MAVLSLDERLNQIEAKISEKSFRENKGLGNEIGFYIFDYDPEYELLIRDKDFGVFFQNKREQSDKVDSWSEYTFKKLKQVYIRILFESGLIANQKGDREIVIPIIDGEVKDYIYKLGDKVYINAILGINE